MEIWLLLLKVLGEALGHVDDEDGVLVKVKQVASITSVDRSPSTVIKMQQQCYNICWKVYDDIQTELAEKTQALKKMKQRVKVEKFLNQFFDTEW